MATKAPLHRPTIDDVIGPTTPANPPPAKPPLRARPAPTKMISAKVPFSLYEDVDELRAYTDIDFTKLIVRMVTPEVARLKRELYERQGWELPDEK